MKGKSSEKDLKRLQRKIEAYKQTLKRAFGTSDLRKVTKMLEAIEEDTENSPLYVI